MNRKASEGLKIGHKVRFSDNRVTTRKRPETDEAKYNRLNKRIVRRLPVTAVETWFVWKYKASHRADFGLPRDPWSYAAKTPVAR